MTRSELLRRGMDLIFLWCMRNGIEAPAVEANTGRSGFGGYGACAYYRNGVIRIWPDACAAIGRAGRQWSYPGYAVDRTPYGVLAHELGHHVDGAHGDTGGPLAKRWRRETGEPPLTTYCPNDNEWFAEHFRLFVTNPDLHWQLAPQLHGLMIAEWLALAEMRSWAEVLAGADRQLKAAANRIQKATKRFNS